MSEKKRGAAIAALKRALGKAVLTGDSLPPRAGIDNARLVFHPSAYIRVENEEQVAKVLLLANKHGVPLTLRGAGSATTGSASPSENGWVLDLTALDSIRIDATAGMAHVGAGATTENINIAAEKEGWFYPPDPSSKKHSTIGGNLATNAGGLRGAKYGVTRDYVFALEGFLPTGERVRWGAPLRKFASGFNVRDLWIGSEGALGVITSATLKLLPKPEARQTFLFGFTSDAQALRAAISVMKARLVPAIMEFMDRQTVDCALRRRREKGPETNRLLKKVTGAFKKAPALLLIELDGRAAVVREDRKHLLELFAKFHGVSARDEAEAESLWEIRRTCSQAMFQMGDTKLNEDIVVPISSYLELLRYTLELKKETGLATPTFGHAADGNFHVHLMYNHGDPAQCRAAERGVKLLMEKVVDLGGAITGEHGIGLAKSPFLKLQHNKAEIEAMLAIKRALDPKDILNPGKMFTPFAMWKHPRDYATVMPWDKH